MLSSIHHHSWVGPVEFLSSDGHDSPHALEDITHCLVHCFQVFLILCLRLIDRGDNAISVSVLQGDIGKFFLETKVDISILKVVIVNLDRTRERVGLCVNHPGSLPFTAPEGIEVGIDATNVNLEVTILVKA